jgi:hypothetical protein
LWPSRRDCGQGAARFLRRPPAGRDRWPKDNSRRGLLYDSRGCSGARVENVREQANHTYIGNSKIAIIPSYSTG